METVGEIVREKGQLVHSTSPGATIFQAVEKMSLHHIGALLVEVGGPLVGIISERDIMTRVILAKRDPATTLVKEVMTRDVLCVEPSTRAREAMALMTEHRCRHLPLVAGGRVVGIIAIGDLVRWASREQEFELRMVTDYVRGAYA